MNVKPPDRRLNLYQKREQEYIVEKIKIEEVSKCFGKGESKVTAIDNVSFEIEQGRFVTILGPSGSGKTTLLRCICGIEGVDKGNIFIGNTEITTMNEEQRKKYRRENIGIVFQQYSLLPILNVQENILLPLKFNRMKPDTEYYSRIVTLLGIDKKLKDKITSLSGGQQQRVAIARALITKPALICADEPTGNLDQANSKEVIHLFQEIRNQFGTTIVMITHDENIAKQSDYTIRIQDG